MGKKQTNEQAVADETNCLTSNIRRTAVSLAVAAALPGAMVAPMTAIAQDDGDEEVIEEIVTYGSFRQSQVDAIATKRMSNTIVEAISAEDIGKLPDSSIAESLSRLPGLSGERRNGRTSGISVRGFKEDYTSVTMNGRELLGIGDNRGVEYDLYPSEIISGVLVYKTPDATMTHQGIGGIVDLRTNRPLDAESHLVINANYEMNDLDSANPEFDDTGHRLALSYSDVFADDTVGLALAYATTESPSQETQFRAWGYNSVGTLNCCNNVIPAPGGTLDDDVRLLEGHDSFNRSATLERDTFSGVLQFAPNEDVTVTLDALYIDFTEDKAFRGVEESHVWAGQPTTTVLAVDNNLVTQGTLDGFHSVVRNDLEEKVAELTTYGINVEWDINEDWTLEFDAATGESDKRTTNIESYSGVGRSGVASRPLTYRTWNMTGSGATYTAHPAESTPDLTDPNLIVLAGPQPWGGGMNPLADVICPTPAACTTTDGTVVNFNNAQDGFVNEPVFDEELTTVKLEASRALDFGVLTGLDVGVYYSDRTKSKENRGFYLTAPTFPNAEPIPDEYLLGSMNLDFMGIDGILAYDSLGLYQSGYYTAYDAADLQTDRLGDTYTIDEELLTVYAKVDFDMIWGDLPVSGNFGLQYVSTDQTGNGFNVVNDASAFVFAAPVTDGDDYSDVLPSLNLNVELADDHMVRLAASKTLSRPRLDDMRPNSRVNFNFNYGNVISTEPESGPWTGNGGNARLKPLEANQLDVSYEWYFADDGFVSAAWFYKDLTNWHKDGKLVADFESVYIPGYHQAENPANPGEIATPGTFLGVVDFRQDGLEGFVRGYELQGNIPFGGFAEPLEGFGLIASAALYDGKLDDGSSVPGLSEETYQSTLYWERGGFQARVSYTKRDKFRTEFPGLSLALTQEVDLGAELIDAQIGYDFGLGGFERLEGLYISLQGQNLTDEDTVQTTDDGREIRRFQSFGANYLLNVNYNFR
ncbi:MAG: TonB-dependent receptor [Gammaproteobacteria bacterium]|nr:TonB-dependent receptor [Gammaproteobacteria bacterium]NNL51933.1 TonB-dependent receptor [Woeseiaceae bacterium]